MTKLDKDQLDKITGGAAVTGQENSVFEAGDNDDSSANTLSEKNENLEDGGTGGGSGQPGFGSRR